jgi:hypothetical protein
MLADCSAAIPAPQDVNADFNNINVLNLLKDTLNSGNNYGFEWRLQAEYRYRSTYTASSDYSGNPTKRPKLTVTYSVMEKHFYLKDHTSTGSVQVLVI